MTERRGTLPRLDLARESVTRLGFSCRLPKDAVDPPMAASLEDGQFSSLSKYSRNKIPHLIYEGIQAVDDGLGFFVNVVYDASSNVPEGRLPPELSREGELLGRLNGPSQACDLLCEVDFRFSSTVGERTGSWFPLPLPFSRSPGGEDSPVSEIRGIRGVKFAADGDKEEERVEYTFLLDRPTNRDQFLYVEFTVVEAITEETPNRVLAEARRIARLLGLSRRLRE